MTRYALPAVYALFVWWFGTGLALYIVGLRRSTHRWSLLGAMAVFAVALCGLGRIASDASTFGLYAAFTLAVLLWGAIEISFLTGFVTGPFRSACPPGSDRVLQAIYAIGAILWHELLLLAAGVAILVLTWGEPNPLGAWTFGLLWIMRLSSKLNLFLGVPVLNDQLLPEPVRYLRHHFRTAPVGSFFAVSVTLATLATLLLAEGSLVSGLVRPEGLMLLATLSALAVVEHWFMVLPLSIERLWGWSLSRRSQTPASATPPAAVTRVHFADEARPDPAPGTWKTPVVAIDPAKAARAAQPSGGRGNVYPHPALAKQRRRP
jgi:putative photosynthetic complex assembly protein 2